VFRPSRQAADIALQAVAAGPPPYSCHWASCRRRPGPSPEEPGVSAETVCEIPHKASPRKRPDAWGVSIHGWRVIGCQASAGSGGSQGFPSSAARMASRARRPWFLAESR
jgi:hypothetical protein